MKVSRLFLLVFIVLVFALGIFIGFSLKKSSDEGKPIDVNPLPKSCMYGGKTYKSGDGFPAEDGCNSCSCFDGNVACTLMACEKN